MLRFAFAVVVLAITASRVCSQQSNSSAPHLHVKVYANEPGLTQPRLLPLALPPLQASGCGKKIDGDTILSLLVDIDGVPRNIMFVKPSGTDVDEFAIKIASASRFQPGTLDGKPVTTAVSLKVQIQSCVIAASESDGKVKYSAKLRAAPVEEVRAPVNPPTDAVFATDANDWEKFALNPPRKDLANKTPSADTGIVSEVSPPVPIFEPETEFTETARRERIQGTCLLSLIVDAHGLPRDVKIEKGVEPTLDVNSLVTVNRYRFTPAMRDGEPVPMHLNVEVSYKRSEF